MTDKLDEQISAMVDGEIGGIERDQLISRLSNDATSAARWERYHLISDVLSNNLPNNVEHDIASSVRAALESEPTILAPRSPSLKEKLSPLVKQAAGFAMAASVAVVAVYSIQDTSLENGSVAVPQVASAPVTAPVHEATTVSATTTPPQIPNPRLNSYLINHNEYSVSTGVQSMLPYMRIVGNVANDEQVTDENR